MARNTLNREHVAFDTSGLFWKIAVRLDSPYLQQIAFIRKMPTYAIACRTSIRRFKRANYQLIEQLNFVQNRIFYGGGSTRSRISVLKLYTHSVNLYTQCKIVHTQKYWYLSQAVKNLGDQVFPIITTWIPHLCSRTIFSVTSK